jgi:uncharacterized protein involved in tolerance to divalent cations
MRKTKKQCLAKWCPQSAARHRFCSEHWWELPDTLREKIELGDFEYWRWIKVAVRFFCDAEAMR